MKIFLQFWVFSALWIGSAVRGNSLSLLKEIYAAEQPPQLQGIGIEEHLGQQLTLDHLRFHDESGQSVHLSQYFFQGKPVILTLVYFQCPMLCNLVLNGLLDSIKKIDWSLGEQFKIVTVSIHPQETPELASQKKLTYLKSYDRSHSELGWHFLTGEESEITSLASQIGFQFRFDPKEKQYIHAAAIFILTPEGKLSRYFYGTSFAPQNLKLGLLEASRGQVARSTLDRVLLFCFHFDPSKNSYTLRLWRIIQVVLCIQVSVLLGLMFYLWKKEPKKITK